VATRARKRRSAGPLRRRRPPVFRPPAPVINYGTFADRAVSELSDEELTRFVKGDARYQTTPATLPGIFGLNLTLSCPNLAPYWCALFELERRRAGDASQSLVVPDLDPSDTTEQISRKLVNFAFRMVSKKYHPDHGGRHEFMLRITKARELLLEAANSRRPKA